MSQQTQPQGFRVTHFDRGRGTGHHALNSMAGPEFMGTGQVFAPLSMLPPALRLGAIAVLLLIGMGGCTAAWIDQQDYKPSPNICRPVDSGIPPERPGTCVPAAEVGAVQ